MTFVVAAIGDRSLWLLTDRRLTSGHRVIKDHAIKSVALDTMDAIAILGYAGLGATAHGTEPSDWMRRVLRGKRLPLERSLGVLTDAMRLKFYPHLSALDKSKSAVGHSVIIPALVGNIPRLYTIDLALTVHHQKALYRFLRHENRYPCGSIGPPRIVYAGSGANASVLQNSRHWSRIIRRMIMQNEEGLRSPLAVADVMARLNYEVSKSEPTVGHRCIVTWRYGPGMTQFNASSQSYSRAVREGNTPVIPTIFHGYDMGELANRFFMQMPYGDQEFDHEKAFLRAWNETPQEPDDDLN